MNEIRYASPYFSPARLAEAGIVGLPKYGLRKDGLLVESILPSGECILTYDEITDAIKRGTVR